MIVNKQVYPCRLNGDNSKIAVQAVWINRCKSNSLNDKFKNYYIYRICCVKNLNPPKPTFIMGFNIGVSSEQTPNNFDCHQFVDRAFYNFVNEGEQYGDESILIRAGQYYELDLSPLLKLVYTWDEVTTDYIKENIQTVDFLLTLTVTLRDKIKNDSSVCDKIKYVWYDQTVNLSQADLYKMITEIGEEMARPFLDTIERQKKEIDDNPNPWKWYFEQGQIIEDLNHLIKSIQCYKDKGFTEIYLTAG